jgi:hypothetical protein
MPVLEQYWLPSIFATAFVYREKSVECPRPIGIGNVVYEDDCVHISLEQVMGKKLYVGNLTFDTTDSDLSKLFEPHGQVSSAQVIMDRDTGRSKGFGFVEMATDQEAQAAIAALNGQQANGRPLTVNEARPKTAGGGGGGGGRGGYGGGGRGGDRRY